MDGNNDRPAVVRVPLRLITDARFPTRKLQRDAVDRMVESISRIGLRTPITVRAAEVCRDGQMVNGWAVITGAHRIAAAHKLLWEEIDAVVWDGTDQDAELWEVAENLHRAELTVLERSNHLDKWRRLTVDQANAQVAHWGHTGGRPDRGHTRTAEQFGLTRREVERAERIASLPDEAQEAAQVAGLADNQSALLRAAAAPDPVREVAAITLEKAKATSPTPRASKKGKPAPLSVDDLEGLLLAELRGDIDWEKRNRASKAQRCLLEYASSLYYGCEQLLTACAPGQRHAVATAITAMGEQVLREVEEAEAQEAEWDAENAEEAAALAE